MRSIYDGAQDPDATWLKKENPSYFGHKGFVTTDIEDDFITHVHVTPAHVSEVREFSNILPTLKVKGRLYGDKGYASQSNKESLRQYGLKNGIMEKAKKNKLLTATQRQFNRMISKVRYKVEQGFGTLKRRFKFERASCLTKVKVHAQMILKGVPFNLLKALNKFKKSLVTPPLRLC